jgi:hypothetical protein
VNQPCLLPARDGKRAFEILLRRPPAAPADYARGTGAAAMVHADYAVDGQNLKIVADGFGRTL